MISFFIALVRVPAEYIKSTINDEICEELIGNKYGKTSTDFRKKFNNAKIYTVEIKSSSLKSKDFINVKDRNELKMGDLKTILINKRRSLNNIFSDERLWNYK